MSWYLHIKEIVRNLRKTQTKAERIFWNAVRNRKYYGLKFDRQYPIQCVIDGRKRFFITDFYCAEYKIAIELDGSVHDDRQEYDLLRTEIINEKGITILRYSNDQIEKSIETVLFDLKQKINSDASLCPLGIERGARRAE